MIGLTPKQRQLYDFIAARVAERGVPPSFEEMRVAGGLSSKSGVYRIIDQLQARGYVKRRPSRARALELITPATITLNTEILTLTDRYAHEHGISRDTAVNELLRGALEAA